MRRIVNWVLGSLAWRWAVTAVVIAGLATVALPAATEAASSATITVLAPGAPANALASVQWLDPASGTWQAVPGWTAILGQTTSSGVPFYRGPCCRQTTARDLSAGSFRAPRRARMGPA